MDIIAEGIAANAAVPRFEDGCINLQETIRLIAEQVANGIMDAGSDQLCGETGNSRNGYRVRSLTTCIGEPLRSCRAWPTRCRCGLFSCALGGIVELM